MPDLHSTSDFEFGDLRPEATGRSTTDFEPGAKVDGYKILSTLGEGGFGIVYLAETEPPLRRRVALKVLKPGMDSKQVMARFEAERQALAVMDHPNIAKVFDAGMTERGQSYFVMEHVKGVPLTEHCDRHKLSIEERLKRFIDVCEAVQHAHQKGIIHRDLKPSNILVTIEGSREVPKVIDFGVSKAIAMPLTEKTLYTEQGQIIGTPEYMSPEQAEMTGQDIDTRTDVYSLGVVLYELLTGCLPFPAEYLRTSGLNHLLKVIREEEPKSPSTKMTSLDANDLKQVSDARQVELSELRKTLKGDLDWITLKAMEKGRQRRYETANGLAIDVQRFLDDEPIIARPPSTAYKLQKLVRRNRAACIAAAAVLVSLVVGLGATTWGLLEVNRQRGIAHNERDSARIAKAAAEKQRDMARSATEAAQQAEARAEAKANELERQIYLMRLTNVETARSRGDWAWLESELDACPNAQRGWEWEYLQQEFKRQFPLTVGGAQEPVFIHNGNRMAAIGKVGPDDRFVRVWDVQTGKQTAEYEHEDYITFIAISPDEKSLACGGYKGEVTIWNLQTGEQVWSTRVHTAFIDGLAFSPDGTTIATASQDATTKLLDVRSGDLLHTVGPLEAPCRKVTFSANGEWLAVGVTQWQDRADVSSFIVEVSTGTVAAAFPGEGHAVPTFRPDGKQIATANKNGMLTVWQWDGSRLSANRTWKASDASIYSLDFSLDGKYLASGEGAPNGRLVKVWETDSGEEVGRLDAGGEVNWLKFSPDGRHVAYFRGIGGIRLWGFLEPRKTLLARVEGDVWTVRFDSTGDKVLVGSWNGKRSNVTVVDATTGEALLANDNVMEGASWLPGGKEFVASTKPDYSIGLFDAVNGIAKKTFVGHKKWALTRVSSTGERLTSISDDGTVRSWDASSGALTSVFRYDDDGLPYYPLIAGISRGGTLVAVAPWESYVVKILDVRQQDVLVSVDAPGVVVESLCFSNDDNYLSVGGSGGTLLQLDVETGQQTRVFEGHNGTVSVTAISPTGKEIVAGDTEGKIIVWDVEKAHALFTLDDDNERTVRSLDWSSDGHRIVAGYRDGTVKAWTLSE